MDISLRAVEPEDVDMMYELENDPHIWAMGSTNVPYSRHALLRFARECQNDIYADKQVRLVVVCDGVPAGCMDLFNLDARNLHAEVAFAILPRFRRRGIATKALRLLTLYAQTHLGLQTLTATTAASNIMAQSLLQRAGFTVSGTLRRWLRIDSTMEDAIIYQIDLAV